MEISFLGTRGNIFLKNKQHRRHTVTVISHGHTRVALDCGLDWLGHIDRIHPQAIVITHAHPDHIGGLQHGAPYPVYATKASWPALDKFPLKDRIIIRPRIPFIIGSLTFEAFTVQHSLRAPAVGYRISAGKSTIFCVHDLIAIKNRKVALRNIDLYIGDGASFTRPIIRYNNHIRFGHTTIKEQIMWCKKEKVPRAIFTHCGSQIVRGPAHTINKRVQEFGDECGVEVEVAFDGMEIIL